MQAGPDANDDYAMGRTEAERDRLASQDRIFEPHSAHFARLAGITEGMRVLDVGCGVGATTMLLARLVGPHGTVIGVDQDPAALATAEAAAAAAGLGNVRFQQATLPGVELDGPVDVVFGRLILIHLDDPASVLRALVALVRPGGVVTFQEPNIRRARSVPEVPLWSQLIGWSVAGLRQAGRHPDPGDRLPGSFRAAGLPNPALASVSVAGDAGSVAAEFVVQAVASLAPLTVASGAATEREIARVDAAMVNAQVSAAQAMLYIPELAAAWVRLPAA